MLSPSISDNPVFATTIEVLHDKFFGKKWKTMIAQVFEESSVGHARLELYQSAEKMKQLKPARTVLLTDCTSMRSSHAENKTIISVRLKDNSSLDMSCNEYDHFMDALSRIAFPKKYVTIPSTSLDSPTSDDEFELFNSYPVLLLPSPTTKQKKLPEGTYSIEFGDKLLLKHGEEIVLDFKYREFLWIAAGEKCLGFEVASEGVLEFICAVPLAIVESFRSHIKFSSIFTPPTVKTVNKYNRCFHPKGNSTANSPESSKNTTMESHHSGLSSGAFSAPDNSTSGSSPMHISFSEDVHYQDMDKKSGSGFFKFLRRNSKKQKDDGGRTMFEQNADSEWMRMPQYTPTKPAVVPELTQNAFQLELKKTLEAAKKRHENMQTHVDEDDC